jgi:hypothetical protein
MGSVGDYYVSLRQKIDKNSFQEGNRKIVEMETGLKKAGARVKSEINPRFDQLTKTTKTFSSGFKQGQAATQGLSGALGSLEVGSLGVLGVTGLLVGAFAAVEAGAFKVAAGVAKASQSTIVQAQSTGLGIEALMKWHRAAQMIGMDSKAMDATFSAMKSQATAFKTWGELSDSQLKNLAMLGEQQGGGKGFVEKWLGMNPEEKVRSVFQVAQGMKDVDKAAYLVNQTLGESGEGLFWSLSARGMNLGKLLTDAKSLGMVTTGDVKRSAAFGDELSKFGVIVNEFKSLLGSELARGFMSPLKEFIDWYKNNKDSVKATAQYVSDSIAGPVILLTKGVDEWVKWNAKNQTERMSETPWQYDKDTNLIRKPGGTTLSREYFKSGLSIDEILSFLNSPTNPIDVFMPEKGLFSKEFNEAHGDVYYINGTQVRMSDEDAAMLKRVFVDPGKIGIKK